MQNSIVSTTPVAVGAAVSSILIFFFFLPASARAQSGAGTYSLFVASGFLCDQSQSGNCLAVAKSANGDSYEMSGAGTFDSQNKSVKAAGTFNHRATNGSVLETGVWVAADLISFDSYGAAHAPLLPKGPAFGTAPTGPRRLSMPSGPTPTGGLGMFRILLIPLSGTTKTAVLQVNCALGDVPRERSVEGIRVTLERNGTEFSEEVIGRVMFISPDVSTALKPEGTHSRNRPTAAN